MQKEEILELLKQLILDLKNKPNDFKDARKKLDWGAKAKHVIESVKSLNEQDTKWLEQNYNTWFKINVNPHIDPKLFNTLSGVVKP